MKKTKLGHYLILALSVLLFYGSSLQYGLSQDDFFHLSISKAGSLGDFFQFFNPLKHDWVFFRPLSTQVFYFLFGSFFSWQQAAVPMHLFALLLHIINSALVYRLVNRLVSKDKLLGLIVAVLYAISPIHFLSLFYVGAVQQLLTTFFSLLLLLSLKSGNRLKQSLLLLLALMSKEIAIRLAPLATLYLVLKQKPLKTALAETKHLYLISLLYLLFRLGFGLSVPAEYVVTFNPFKLLASVMWYGLFSLGLPENLLRYGLSGGRINFVQFFLDHPPSTKLLAFGALVLLYFSLKSLLANKSKQRSWFLLLWWILGIAPILPFVDHRYPHYLDLSLIALLVLVFSKLSKKLSLLVFLLVFYCSYLGISLEKTTHWTIGRSIIVKNFAPLLESGSYCQGDSLLITGPGNVGRELSYALMLEHGPQIICNNDDLRIYYSGVNYEGGPVDRIIEVTNEVLR